MPTRTIPVIGPQGILTDNDSIGVTADFRYFVNGYFEKTNSEEPNRKFAFTKRPGCSVKFDSVTPFTASHRINGLMSSIDRTSMIAYTNNTITTETWYIPNTGIPVSRGVAPAAAGTWTKTGAVALCALDGISYGSNVYYCATDFTKGAVIDGSGNWTEITDADFTGLNKCTNMIGMDGYLFIGTTNNRLYNSDLNTSTSWAALNFLSVADVPGRLMWLARIRNFLIVFKDKSIEFFEDVGNPAPGSPLEPRKSLNSRIGLLHRNTVREVSDGIIFAGTTETGMSRMYKISHQNMSIEPISDRHIEQLLPGLKIATTTSDYSVDSRWGTGASANFTGQSQVFYLDGKEFYTVNIPNVAATGNRVTQVYDNTLGLWSAWTTSFITAGVTDTWGFECSQAVPLLIGNVNTTVFVNNYPAAVGATYPRLIAIDPSNPLWYDVNIDNSTQHYYTFAWTSEQFDFGNRKRKFCDLIEILYTGDSSAAPSLSATSSTTSLTLIYRDYDYSSSATYSGTRTLYYDPGGGVRCVTRQIGNFRRRSLNVKLEAITPFKIWGVEITYNQGEEEQEG